jgi:hypothetical protein
MESTWAPGGLRARRRGRRVECRPVGKTPKGWQRPKWGAASLSGTKNAEFLHPRLEGRPLEAQDLGGAMFTADPPPGFLENASPQPGTSRTGQTAFPRHPAVRERTACPLRARARYRCRSFRRRVRRYRGLVISATAHASTVPRLRAPAERSPSPRSRPCLGPRWLNWGISPKSRRPTLRNVGCPAIASTNPNRQRHRRSRLRRDSSRLSCPSPRKHHRPPPRRRRPQSRRRDCHRHLRDRPRPGYR